MSKCFLLNYKKFLQRFVLLRKTYNRVTPTHCNNVIIDVTEPKATLKPVKVSFSNHF